MWPPAEVELNVAWELELIEPPPDGGSQDWYREATARAARLGWISRDFLVDGEPVEFRVLRKGSEWEAWSVNPSVRVSLDGRGYGGFPQDEVEFVTIDDATPYLRGTRHLRGSRR